MNSVEKAVLITAGFEGGRGYSNVAGNFDGQGLSFGLLQWNAGQHTLQPILRNCLKGMPKTVEEIFTPEGLKELKAALATDDGFFKWCLSINDDKNRIKEPWYTRFWKLGLTGGCQKYQREAMKNYLIKARQMMDTFGFQSERAFALCYDIAVQNGSVVNSAKAEYQARLKPGMTEKSKLFILAASVANHSSPKVLRYIKGKAWTIQDDVRSRKICIYHGEGSVHGKYCKLTLTDEKADFGNELL
jgi:hypothetical protein